MVRRGGSRHLGAVVYYLGSQGKRQYVPVVTGGPPVSHPFLQPSAPSAAGATVMLSGVLLRGQDRHAPAAVGVSLQVPPGQSVAFHAPADGTAVALLDVVAGLRRPKSGQVVVGGVAVHQLSGAAVERYRRERGLLSDRFPLLSSLSVTDNVLAALNSRRPDSAARERAAEVLVITGAAGLAARPVESLSAEQRWRVLIARALLSGPRLVLAEDPVPGQETGAARILNLLMDAHARFGFTLLLATSRLATAARCERVVSLADGLLTADEVSRDDAWTRGRVDRIG
jgi:ABC-type methionine transport system ATPase subunit